MTDTDHRASPSQQRRQAALLAYAHVTSWVIIATGGLVLVGWALDIVILKSFIPGYPTMKPNTAVAASLAGLALWLSAAPRHGGLARLQWVASSGVALIGLLTLSQYVFGWDLGIDRLLFRQAVELDSQPPGRMSPATAFSFSLLGCGWLWQAVRQQRSTQFPQWGRVVVAAVAMLAILGYVYDAQSLASFGFSNAISLHTALMFLFLATGALCINPERNPARTLTSDLAGGVMIRRLLPSALGLLFLLGWLVAVGETLGYYDIGVLTGLFVLASTLLLTVLIWRAAVSLERTDAERHQAADAQRQQAERLSNLRQIDQDILTARPFGEVADSMLERLSHLIPSQRLSVALIDWETETVQILATWVGLGASPPSRRVKPLDKTLLDGLRAGQLIQVDDLQALPEPVAPGIQDFIREGMRTYIGVPLRAQGELFGTLNLFAHRPGAYSPDEIEIATEVAAQVAIAIRQARAAEQIQRHTQELEARVAERTASLQTALTTTHALYDVARSAISADSLPTILQVMVDHIAHTLDANRATLITFDQQAQAVAHIVSGGPGVEQVVLSVSYQELLQGLSGWVLREGRPALSPQGQPDPRESPAVQRRRIETNCGSIIVVPLRNLKTVFGTLTAINTPDQREFDEHDLNLIEAIANQAAAAIVKAQLLEQVQHQLIELQQAEAHLRRQNEFLSTLHRITLDLIGRRDLGELLQALVENAAQLLDAPYGEIMLLEDEMLVVQAATRNQPDLVGDRATREQALLSWQAYETRAPVVIEDYATWPHRRSVYDKTPVHAIADFPILHNDQCLGVLALGRDTPAYLFTKEQIWYGHLLAQLAALVLDNAQLRESLHQQAIRDPLTGLFNRRYLEVTLERETRRATRNQQPLGIIMLDIDHFKRFNDTFGHAAGDLLLAELGRFLQRHIRGEDIACRYGGEEFTLILPNASLEVTRQRAELLRTAIHHLHLEFDGQPLGAVTLSLGVAIFPQPGRSIDAIVQAADEALYAAKRGGRNRVCVAGEA